MSRITEAFKFERDFGHTDIEVTIDGRRKELFSYYPDELSFTTGELIGLTEQEARALRHAKDLEYLQS